jgi:hypothetical protein
MTLQRIRYNVLEGERVACVAPEARAHRAANVRKPASLPVSSNWQALGTPSLGQAIPLKNVARVPVARNVERRACQRSRRVFRPMIGMDSE